MLVDIILVNILLGDILLVDILLGDIPLVDILLVDIGAYFRLNYHRLLVVNLLMFIGGY
jgi:hypothetical protein